MQAPIFNMFLIICNLKLILIIVIIARNYNCI